MRGAAVVMPAAPCFLSKKKECFVRRPHPSASMPPRQKVRRAVKRAGLISTQSVFDQEAAARGARLRELRWKNSAWLATAETIAGWNGFEIRHAGSGASPGRHRSG